MPNTGKLGGPDSELGNIILGYDPAIVTPVVPSVPATPSNASSYSFVIADIDGVEIDEIEPINPIWSYVLNDSGTASLAMPTRDPMCRQSLLKPLASELHIYRAGTLVWGGHLYTYESTIEDTTRFSFSGYFERTKYRYIDISQNFNNRDQFDIAWSLIAFTKAKTNGTKGMNWSRFSAANSGITRDINYTFWERTTIYDAIKDLSTLGGGFDFEVTPNKEWKTYYPSKGGTVPTPFEAGKNILGMTITGDGVNVANVFAALGAGDGKNTCIAVATDSAGQALYGLMEMSESDTDVKHFATLSARAQEGLRMSKTPRIAPSISVRSDHEPFPYTYSVGDRVNVFSADGYAAVNQQMRIISIVTELSNEGREAITLEFDDKVDV